MWTIAARMEQNYPIESAWITHKNYWPNGLWQQYRNYSFIFISSLFSTFYYLIINAHSNVLFLGENYFMRKLCAKSCKRFFLNSSDFKVWRISIITIEVSRSIYRKVFMRKFEKLMRKRALNIWLGSTLMTESDGEGAPLWVQIIHFIKRLNFYSYRWNEVA